MDLRKLEFFHAVVRSGSFKRAAELCHVSPPALTKGIQSLEHELEVTLFDRRRGDPSLTPAGQTLLERARRILDEADEIHADMQRERGLETGEIRVGCGPIVLHSIFGRALAKLSIRHPGIRVTVVSGNWENLTRQLLDYSLDLVAADIGDAGARDQFHVTEILSEPLIWVSAPGHPLAGKQRIPVGVIEKYPLAIPTAPLHMIQRLQGLADSPLVQHVLNPNIRCDSYSALISAVKGSQCLTALPRSLAKPLVMRGELTELAVSDWNLSSHAGIITLAKRPPSVAREAMERAIIEVSVELAEENQRLG